ncbi:hypothetical protein [Nocardia brasiliensis]|uniref:hypothetical protein n=1 Tax=Nocardia brasiliensis TaxID=37326 RepID=UPI002456579F|nr:hypothetical protein [Nocardia brasiliensis]
MRYVDLNATVGELTGVLSPAPYLRRLPELAVELPTGARAFATDPEHYDFYGKRCVKDLKFLEIRGTDTGLELRLRHNCWKHDEDLTIRYTAPTHRVVTLGDPGRTGFHELILDEILPHPDGCTHELVFHTGTIMVTCADLAADWTAADCPDLPQRRDH